MAETESADVSVASVSSNPLTKKLNKVLDTRLENDKELLEALKSLSGVFTDNCLRSRRSLRSDIEKRSLAINEQFVDAFKAVTQELENVYCDMRDMNGCCQDMTSRLQVAKAQTRDLLNQTTALKANSEKIRMKSEVTDAFLRKFQLKPEEVKVLHGTRATQLHEDFFTVLARVKQIHSDCKVLLRTNYQTAGLEIMEAMALHQETAYERLYRWTQNECRLLTGDYPDISQLLCQSVQALSDRPVLFRYVLDEFGTARRTALVRGFIDALTRGGHGGTPRPIELHSHDPLRYVGDMLAWVHQSMASEKEHLQSLLRLCSQVDETLQETLSHITEGLCRPFKVRIEQVLLAGQDAVLLYKLSNLLKFYHNTIKEMLADDSPLAMVTGDMETLADRVFFTSLSSYVAKLVDKVDAPLADLSGASVLTDSIRVLKDVLASHDSFILPIADKKMKFKQILSCILEPLLQMCSVSASRLATADMATFMVNSLYQIQSTLALYEYTDDRIDMLQAQIDAHVDTLVNEQASFILARVDLVRLYGHVQNQTQLSSPENFSTMDGCNENTVKSAMVKFDAFLASPDALCLPQCNLLLSNTIREKIRRGSLDLIIAAYTQMYDVISTGDHYRDPHSIAPRTPEHVTRLLN